MKTRLIKAQISQGNNLTTERYKYDYQGNRIEKQTNEELPTNYILDDSTITKVLAETKGNQEPLHLWTRTNKPRKKWRIQNLYIR